jgi:hypothetical protein
VHATAAGWRRETTLPDVTSAYPNLQFASTDSTRTTTRRLAPVELPVTCSFSYLLQGRAAPETSVAAADLDDVVGVVVRVTVDGDGSGPLRPVVLENTVRPYNL